MGTRIHLRHGARKIVGSLGHAMLDGLEGVATFAETNTCQRTAMKQIRSIYKGMMDGRTAKGYDRRL